MKLLDQLSDFLESGKPFTLNDAPLIDALYDFFDEFKRFYRDATTVGVMPFSTFIRAYELVLDGFQEETSPTTKEDSSVKAIEQIKDQCRFDGKLDEEQEKLFGMIERLFHASKKLYLDLEDAGQDTNEKGAQWSIFAELVEALNDIERGHTEFRTVDVTVETSLTEEQLKVAVANAVSQLAGVDKVKVEKV